MIGEQQVACTWYSSTVVQYQSHKPRYSGAAQHRTKRRPSQARALSRDATHAAGQAKGAKDQKSKRAKEWSLAGLASRMGRGSGQSFSMGTFSGGALMVQ